MSAPFFMKLKFTPPREGKIKDPRYVQYIATRPGAVLKDEKITLTEKDLIKELDINAEEDKHTEYISNRPGSHGLFGSSPDKAPDLDEIKRELQNHPGVTWRGILSLKEEDAIRVNYVERGAWESMLRSQISSAVEKMGIERSNLRWVAAFHEAKGHPHVHLIFWEKNPQRTTGQLSPEEMKGMKRAFAGEIFREERLLKMMEKTATRDLIMKMSRDDLSEARNTVRQIKSLQPEARIELKLLFGNPEISLPPDFYRINELGVKLQQLAKQMPGKGRVALQFMPGDVKQEARDIAKWIMQRPRFYQNIEKYLKAQEELARTYTTKPEQLKEAREKSYNDLRDRVANTVIKGAADINRLEKHEMWDAKNKQIASGRIANTVWRSTWRVVENEMTRSEAQAEHQKRMEARRQERQKNKPARKNEENKDNYERSND